jgi:hypothetical protein
MTTKILGLMVIDRIKEAGETQKVLAEYAQVIKTRLGFHEVTENVCSRHGIIILQIAGDADKCEQLEEKLSEISGIQLKSMVFNPELVNVSVCEN